MKIFFDTNIFVEYIEERQQGLQTRRYDQFGNPQSSWLRSKLCKYQRLNTFRNLKMT